MNGVDKVTVAKLLGLALVKTTGRYVHLSDHPLPTPPTGCRGASMPPRPDGTRGKREEPAMPTVEPVAGARRSVLPPIRNALDLEERRYHACGNGEAGVEELVLHLPA